MYKAARDVHTNGIHNTFTSKGRGKMNHIKQFFREKGLYLFCLAMVFAATAAGILALRTVVSNVADLTRTRKEALQNDSAWTQPDTAIDKPAQDVPKPTTTPAATEKPSATPAPAAAQAPKATAAPPAQTATKPGIWDAKPLAAFSGNELVYSATLGDWRTHNGNCRRAACADSCGQLFCRCHDCPQDLPSGLFCYFRRFDRRIPKHLPFADDSCSLFGSS